MSPFLLVAVVIFIMTGDLLLSIILGIVLGFFIGIAWMIISIILGVSNGDHMRGHKGWWK